MLAESLGDALNPYATKGSTQPNARLDLHHNVHDVPQVSTMSKNREYPDREPGCRLQLFIVPFEMFIFEQAGTQLGALDFCS